MDTELVAKCNEIHIGGMFLDSRNSHWSATVKQDNKTFLSNQLENK